MCQSFGAAIGSDFSGNANFLSALEALCESGLVEMKLAAANLAGAVADQQFKHRPAPTAATATVANVARTKIEYLRRKGGALADGQVANATDQASIFIGARQEKQGIRDRTNVAPGKTGCPDRPDPGYILD